MTRISSEVYIDSASHPELNSIARCVKRKLKGKLRKEGKVNSKLKAFGSFVVVVDVSLFVRLLHTHAPNTWTLWNSAICNSSFCHPQFISSIANKLSDGWQKNIRNEMGWLTFEFELLSRPSSPHGEMTFYVFTICRVKKTIHGWE